ncbi:prepilin-type N-terminal cleavage/methylation domain-containing protein [Opitutus sp. GAS368]|uniref:PilW family protein n=1 Tax=Opitutus sp. GAS368 TaxID=1882749 RepID=UPI00087A513C|nr:prepilin-type N-terminal cleavage/methylation domain-containing protein [Opitutus sp. GAS368]SDS66468.1 prepilin-type N-terminal cleavage/methylation domain-containing protein [Opitutus sp. GAS368]
MTSSHYNITGRRSNRRAGFTLVEVLMAMSLSLMVLAGTLTAFLMLLRSGIRVSNYSMMESQTRRAFEQLGVDARMANGYASIFTNGTITACTFTIPSEDLSTISQVTYGFDHSNSANGKFFSVPGNDPTATTGRVDLVQYVTSLTFNRYDSTSTLIPASTTSDSGIKHIQVSINVSRGTLGVAATTQVIRSSAFTIRNITI